MQSWLLKPPDFGEFPRLVAEARFHSRLIAGETVWHRKSKGGSNKCGGIPTEFCAAAAYALEAGDRLGALKRVASRARPAKEAARARAFNVTENFRICRLTVRQPLCS
jgi:hypothetical protein